MARPSAIGHGSPRDLRRPVSERLANTPTTRGPAALTME